MLFVTRPLRKTLESKASAIKKCGLCGKYSRRALAACRHCGETFADTQPSEGSLNIQPPFMGLAEANYILEFTTRTAQRAYMQNSMWGKAYFFLDSVLGFILMPLIILQLISTFVLGIVVQITFGLALLPMSIPWLPMMRLMLGGSRLWIAVPVLRPVLIVPLLLVSQIAGKYVAFMPSMGEWDSRMMKLAICHGCPASHIAMNAWSQEVQYGN